MREFFSKDPATAKKQIVDELYHRLEVSRKLHRAFSSRDSNPWDRGYISGVSEEVRWLEKLLDQIEKS